MWLSYELARMHIDELQAEAATERRAACALRAAAGRAWGMRTPGPAAIRRRSARRVPTAARVETLVFSRHAAGAAGSAK
ncbi:MAG: hypothetical protein M3Q27_02740 [Actinomycetota bacterium]|nr:hypothetical protein [Actinomycetota bacterium]